MSIKPKKWFSDQDVLKFLCPNTPFTTNPNEKVTVEEFIEYVRNDPELAYFRIEHPAYGFIGHIGLDSIDLNYMSFFTGCVIGEKKYWGKGIGTTAEKMVLSRAKELGFKSAKASVHEDNIVSISILTKQLGMGISEGNQVNFTKAL